MNNNRLLAFGILILIFAGAAFWIVWGIVLNKGTVIFNYERPPFTVSIAEEEKTCLSRECGFWIPVGPRAYTITKDGYYEKTGSINIVRDKKLTENIDLEFIPQAAEGIPYNTFNFSAGYSKFSDSLKDISLFADIPGDYTLKGMPKIINNIIFSETGNNAVIFEDNFEDNKVSIYSTKDFKIKTIEELKDAVSVVFSDNETELYGVSYDETAKKYALKKINIEETAQEKSPESLVYFGRDVKNYELSLAEESGLISLVDKTFSPQIIYIIDLNVKSRTNIFEGYLIEAGKWSQSGEVFVFKAKGMNENFSSLYYYSAGDKLVQKLGVSANLDNISFLDGKAVFVSSQNYSITNYSVPYMIQFDEQNITTFEEISAQNINGGGSNNNGGLNNGSSNNGGLSNGSSNGGGSNNVQTILAKWDLSNGNFYMVKDLSGIISSVPEKIELSPDGKVVRMLIDGMIYDIRIGE